jgi:prolipoprotein diacylglyceryl transferase
LIALAIYVRGHRTISFIEWADIAAPGLALGQAIGRWGNFFNQELYGAPTNLPSKIYIDPAHRLAGFQDISYYHPLFAYESILNLANMLLLLWFTRQYAGKLKKGDVFNIYLIVYPVIRFSLDFLRLDASRVFSINVNQTLSAVVAVCAVIVLIWRHRSGLASEPEAPTAATSPMVGSASGPGTVRKSVVARKPRPAEGPGRVKSSKAASKRTSPRKSASKTPAKRKTAAKKSAR